MNEIKTFSSMDFGTVRIMMIEEEPWFVGKDVTDILGYQNGSRDVNRHVDEEDRRKTMVFDGNQSKETIVINESGLYSLIFSSKLPTAKAFKYWVTHEVLPSIRKNGGYISGQDSLDEMEIFAKALKLADKVLADRNRKLAEANNTIAIQNQQILEMEPKVSYYDIVLQCKNAIPVTIIAKDYGMTANAMNQLLHELGIQYHVNKTWVLYKDYAGNGYTKSKTYPIPGTPYSNVVTQWTQKGRLFIYDLLKSNGYLPRCEQW